MANDTSLRFPINRTRIISMMVVNLCSTAVIIRTLARPDIQSRLSLYLALELVSLALLTLVLWHPIRWKTGVHLVFAIQTLIVLVTLLLNPKFDFVAVLFVTLAFEAAWVFPGPIRWRWVVVLIVLTGLPLIASQGMYGLALSVTPIAACIIFPAFVSLNQEIVSGLRTNQSLLDQLQEANQQLSAYASQLEELSIIQEHDWLSGQLQGSVSKSINRIIQLNHAAKIILENDPDQTDSQLVELQTLAQGSLEQMRGLIARLRPPENGSIERPTT